MTVETSLRAEVERIAAQVSDDEAGLPIGVHIVGPHWFEIRLLEIAAELEEAGILPKFARPPGY